MLNHFPIRLVNKEMEQLGFWEVKTSPKVTNVSAVTHRSPFRYPGGKTWFVPRVRRWLKWLGYKPAKFIEPFAGGAITGLTVAFENLAETVVLVEKDEQVAAVWQTIILQRKVATGQAE